jgi:hypothetical protein
MHVFRLKPSTIPGAGVGVFATADIPAGTPLPELFAADDVRFVPWPEFPALPEPAEVAENFAVRYDDGAYLPRDFNRISVGWFLNDSREPNLPHDAEYVYSALRNIAAGEELLIDYDRL